MKCFFKTFFIFLIMAISLVIEPSDLQAKEFYPEASIQAIAKETVEIVANNFYGGEICSYQEENNQNSSGSSPQIISFLLNNSLLLANKTQFNGCFIHNLSTNLKEVQQIRAP